MHSYLTFKHQPFVYTNYSLFVAEVASNFHQAMMRGHLLNTVKDKNFQMALIEEAVGGNFFRYFFQMPTLARFELETHQRIERGESLTADDMIDLMADLFGEGRIAAPLRDAQPPGDNLPFTRPNITMVPQIRMGGTSLAAHAGKLLSAPAAIWGVSSAMRKADVVHVRCPGNLGLIGPEA